MITTENEQVITVTARRITAKSLYKLIFLSGLIPGAIFFFFIGITAANGAENLRFNGEYVTGLPALFLSILLYVPMLAIWSAMLWLIAAPGLLLYSFWKPIELKFKG